MLNYRYKTFLVVCDTLNYTLAAEKLNITQPAVSNHISYLEETLHVQLFIKQYKKITMTEAARLLYEKVSFLTNFSKATLEQLANLDYTNFSLGYTEVVNYNFIASLVTEVIEDYSHLNLSLIIADSAHLLKELESGRLDAAIIVGDFDHHIFKSQSIYNDSLVGVHSSKYPVTSNINLQPIYINKSIFYFYQDQLPIFNQQIFINNDTLVKKIIKENSGISFLLESTVEDELSSRKLSKITLPKELPLIAVSLVYLTHTPIIDSILAFIKKNKRSCDIKSLCSEHYTGFEVPHH